MSVHLIRQAKINQDVVLSYKNALGCKSDASWKKCDKKCTRILIAMPQ